MRTEEPTAPPTRSFGLLVAGAVVAVVAYRSVIHGAAVSHLWLLAALGVLVLTLAAPSALALPAALWMRLGYAMGALSNPILLGLVFFLIVSPLGCLMRVLGKSSIHLGPNADLETYWIERPAVVPESTRTMIEQF